MKKLMIAIILTIFAPSSWCLEVIKGNVILVEPTYLPQTVTFILDAGNETCPAKRWLRWGKDNVENNLAVYSTLMAAMLSGKPVRVHVNDGDTDCMVQYLHLLES